MLGPIFHEKTADYALCLVPHDWLVLSGISLSLFDYDLLFELSQNILMPYLYLTSLTLAHGPGVMTPQARRNSSLHTNQTLISRDTKYEWEENLYV